MGHYSVRTCSRCNTPIEAHGFKKGEGPTLQPSYDVEFVSNARRNISSCTSEKTHEFKSSYKYFTHLCSECTEGLKSLVEAVDTFLTTPGEAPPTVVPEPPSLPAPGPRRITAPARRALGSR